MQRHPSRLTTTADTRADTENAEKNRLNRSGHLFQCRSKAILVDADEDLVQLVGYLHLNPVRTGMVQSPGDYPWSSHWAYLGREIIPCLAA
jgi:hypothetical protein